MLKITIVLITVTNIFEALTGSYGVAQSCMAIISSITPSNRPVHYNLHSVYEDLGA